MIVALLAAVVGHLPLAATIAALSRRTDVALAALTSFWRMLVVFAGFGAVRILVLIGGVAFAIWVADSTSVSSGEVAAFRFGVVAFLPFAALLWLTAVIEDYVYVGVVEHTKIRDALLAAWRALRRRTVAPLLHYAARLAGQIALLALSSMISGSLGGQAGSALVVLFIAHQAIQLARIYLKINWLAYVVASRGLSSAPREDISSRTVTEEPAVVEEPAATEGPATSAS